MTIFVCSPACAPVGVPDRRPVVGEKVAHAGRFWMLNVSTSPSGSLAAGVNEYGWSAVTVGAG